MKKSALTHHTNHHIQRLLWLLFARSCLVSSAASHCIRSCDILTLLLLRAESYETFKSEIFQIQAFIGFKLTHYLQITFRECVIFWQNTEVSRLSCCLSASHFTILASAFQVVNFACPVRSSHTQTLHVFNPVNQQCSIRPVIEGEQWSAAPSVILEPLQNKAYEITYRPLTMTADAKKHLVEEPSACT